MVTVEERLTRLETEREHLATKADVAELRAELANVENRLIRWTVGTMGTGLGAGVGIVAAVLRAT